jgi:hypothetical protein
VSAQAAQFLVFLDTFRGGHRFKITLQQPMA